MSFREKGESLFMTTTTSKTKAKNQPSRQPNLLDYLKSLTKEDLVNAATQLCVAHSKMNKEELQAALYKEMLRPEVMAARFAIMPAENIKAFEAALEKECFAVTPKENDLLRPFYSMGYIVSYEDAMLEVPQQTRDLYAQINTEEFQAKRQKLSWLMDCEDTFAALHVVAPVETFYNMYTQKRGYKLSLDEFKALLEEIPANFNQCIIRGERIILKDVLKDNFYLELEKSQEAFSFYMPTTKEIAALAQYRYLKDEPSYKALYSFLREELKQQASYAHYWCDVAYNNFNMGDSVDKLVEALAAGGLSFADDEQKNKFKALAKTASEEGTRMYCLRGHTLKEMNLIPQAPQAVLPYANHFQPDSNLGWDINKAEAVEIPMPASFGAPTNDRVGAKAKKVYPNDPCPCGSGKKYKKCCGRKK